VNAQNTLERLQAILTKGGKIHNLLAVQRQLSNVGAEIARLEAERVSREHQVTLAQVLLSLREELNPPVESVAAELRAAAVAGSSQRFRKAVQ
jgi:cob(I)alamin adenosyltransferase